MTDPLALIAELEGFRGYLSTLADPHAGARHWTGCERKRAEASV